MRRLDLVLANIQSFFKNEFPIADENTPGADPLLLVEEKETRESIN
jgi:hypothetical protein